MELLDQQLPVHQISMISIKFYIIKRHFTNCIVLNMTRSHLFIDFTFQNSNVDKLQIKIHTIKFFISSWLKVQSIT